MNKIFALAVALILLSSQAWAEPSNSDYARANVKCVRAVEEVALYDFKWMDSWYEMKFEFVMRDKVTNFDSYATDKIRFQNGFGAWLRYVCVCVWDAFPEKIMGVECLKK